MMEHLRAAATPTCDASNCTRTLAGDPTLAFQTEAGERRAYECACGAVTVTVVRGEN